MENIIVEKVWLTDTEVWIRTTDGKEACEKFSDFQRLKWATPAQRANFTTSHDGIHWRELDEDLSFEGFFRERKSNPLYDLFIAHPELNAAGRGAFLGEGSITGRGCGLLRRENAGMSSESKVRILAAEYPRFPE